MEKKNSSPYKLGTVIYNIKPNLDKYGITTIAHLITIKKDENDCKIFEEHSIMNGIKDIFQFCRNNKISNVFIPVFGIGKKDTNIAEIEKTIRPVINLLNQNYPMKIYFGVYKQSHELLAIQAIINSIK